MYHDNFKERQFTLSRQTSANPLEQKPPGRRSLVNNYTVGHKNVCWFTCLPSTSMSFVFMVLLLIFCISQGGVATYLRYDGKYITSLVVNLLLSPTVKEFSKSANISQGYQQISSGTFFYGPRCIIKLKFLFLSNLGFLCSHIKLLISFVYYSLLQER